MSGPAAFTRQMVALEKLLAAPPSWDGLTQSFAPAQVPDSFDPGDAMKMFWAAFVQTEQGRAAVEWLAELTIRAPYPHVGPTLESAGIAAAKHEARAAVGQVLMRAIADGTDLLDQKRSQTDATSA